MKCTGAFDKRASMVPARPFWQPQARPDSCRMHAVNALAGRAAFATWEDFVARACDAYDASLREPMARGTSRTLTLPGQLEFAVRLACPEITTVCTVILQHDTEARHALAALLQGIGGPEMASPPPDASRPHLRGVLLFDQAHIFAAVPTDPWAPGAAAWWVLDSLRPGPSLVHLPTLLRTTALNVMVVSQCIAPPVALRRIGIALTTPATAAAGPSPGSLRVGVHEIHRAACK
jgi:hypothetical protein